MSPRRRSPPPRPRAVQRPGFYGIALADHGGLHRLSTRAARDPLHIHDHASHLNIKAREPIDVAIVGAQLDPGGETGWHTHPADSIVSLPPGAPTLEMIIQRAQAVRTQAFQPGQAFVHPAGPHNFVTDDATLTLTFGVAYFVPVGSTLLTAAEPPRRDAKRCPRQPLVLLPASSRPAWGDVAESPSRGRAALGARRPRPRRWRPPPARPPRDRARPANIFGAGSARPPAPAGGGAGVLPRGKLPAPHKRRHLPRGHWESQPDRRHGRTTAPPGTASARRTSSPTAGSRGSCTAGTACSSSACSSRRRAGRNAPPRLDFTKRESARSRRGSARRSSWATARRACQVPDGATRLYLGFADGYLYVGPPGWYDNNGGELAATVKLRKVGRGQA